MTRDQLRQELAYSVARKIEDFIGEFCEKWSRDECARLVKEAVQELYETHCKKE